MFATILGFFARSALMTSPAGAILKRIPRQVWIALAVAAVLVAAIIWHQAKAHAAIDRAVKAAVASAIDKRDGQWRQRLDQEHRAALAWKGRADAQLAQISKLQRKLTDEETRRIDADRRAMLLRGPGKAAAPAGCRPGDHPGLPGIAGRHVAQPGAAADAGTEMPAVDGSDQWAVVPWDWLVAVVSERDAFRFEAIGWRGWHASITGAWGQLRSQAPKPSPPAKGTTDGR